MKFPKHVGMDIHHNPHALEYQTVEQWMVNQGADGDEKPADWIAAEDLAAIRETGEIWFIRWYPTSPVGQCYVAAATLDRALELANKE